MSFETLLYEKSDGVATITLNRPKVYNAFNLTMAHELKQAWEDVKSDGQVVCAIVTGAGEKAFCTGMDVADVAAGETQDTTGMSREDAPWFQLTAIQNKCWKPVITAVNGMVNGGGLHFISDSDLIVCSEQASFFDTHVKVGLIAGLEPVGLTRRIPFEAVMRMALLGGAERMSAQQALELGLVGEVLPPDQVMPRARQLAEMMTRHSPTALARTKKALWQGLDTGLDEALERTWAAIDEHTSHPDLDEGAKAFVEKRKPRWAPYSDKT
ncbi:MAG: enoyl-CoA hydratase/isomerase family protein [bacterium]|nr:enoyl-CoA hydratase/isomerase family protein [bacterium]